MNVAPAVGFAAPANGVGLEDGWVGIIVLAGERVGVLVAVAVPGVGLPATVGTGPAPAEPSAGWSPPLPPEISIVNRIVIPIKPAAAAAPAMYQTLRDLTLTLPPQVGQKG